MVTDKGRVSGDVYVLCLGVYSPSVGRELGVDLPIYPVKGYSITVPVAGRNNPPRIGGVDEENLTAYCPLGDRLRVTATAEFSGYDDSPSAGRLPPHAEGHQGAVSRRRRLFAGRILGGAAADDAAGHADPRARASSAICGYNTGQGHMGCTMSHGGARITADLIAGRKPGIPLDGLTLAR